MKKIVLSVNGGEGNSIIGSPGTCPSWAHHSVIGGGKNNTDCSDCSSILGGSGNTIPFGMPNTHIIGSGITSVNTGALHVNDLWANGLCFNPVGAPAAGTIFVMPGAAAPPFALSATGGRLWIM